MLYPQELVSLIIFTQHLKRLATRRETSDEDNEGKGTRPRNLEGVMGIWLLGGCFTQNSLRSRAASRVPKDKTREMSMGLMGGVRKDYFHAIYHLVPSLPAPRQRYPQPDSC